jgi:1-pyrroline-5-carboxylate dehydrogenase
LHLCDFFALLREMYYFSNDRNSIQHFCVILIPILSGLTCTAYLCLSAEKQAQFFKKIKITIMQYGDFYYPMPSNEPVLNYAPGSPEKVALKAALKELKATKIDVPMYIGNEEVRTGNTMELRPPHERKHLLGHFHVGEAKHVTKAINAALKVKDKWANMSWENRANIFLKAADLLAGKYRPYINGTTMLGQSKNAFQAEIDAACELIDFLRFNVHFLSDIYRQQPISGAGMNNRNTARWKDSFLP